MQSIYLDLIYVGEREDNERRGVEIIRNLRKKRSEKEKEEEEEGASNYGRNYPIFLLHLHYRRQVFKMGFGPNIFFNQMGPTPTRVNTVVLVRPVCVLVLTWFLATCFVLCNLYIILDKLRKIRIYIYFFVKIIRWLVFDDKRKLTFIDN